RPSSWPSPTSAAPSTAAPASIPTTSPRSSRAARRVAPQAEPRVPHMAISAPPRPDRRGVAPSPTRRVRRIALVPVGRWLMAAGTLIAVTGAGLDAWRHLSDQSLIHHEAVVSFGNPAHALLVVGIA